MFFFFHFIPLSHGRWNATFKITDPRSMQINSKNCSRERDASIRFLNSPFITRVFCLVSIRTDRSYDANIEYWKPVWIRRLRTDFPTFLSSRVFRKFQKFFFLIGFVQMYRRYNRQRGSRFQANFIIGSNRFSEFIGVPTSEIAEGV